MGLYIAPVPAKRASDAAAAAGGVTLSGTCVGMCLPTCLVGVAASNTSHPAVLLEKAAPSGDLGLAGRSCWSPDGRRELGYLSVSSVEERLVWLPYAHGASWCSV